MGERGDYHWWVGAAGFVGDLDGYCVVVVGGRGVDVFGVVFGYEFGYVVH